MTPQEERDLREAFENVWGELTVEQINNLDPGTVHLARHNHYLLHHADSPQTPGE